MKPINRYTDKAKKVTRRGTGGAFAKARRKYYYKKIARYEFEDPKTGKENER